ncbi:MAG: hypothetical protein WAU69_04015 [Solirubrobacteraceae bacterium]
MPSSELVACVGSILIDGATLDHWMRIAWLSSGSLRRRPKLRALDEPALSFLIQAQWITGEAAALGISLSEAEVHAQFVKLRRQQFPHKHEFDVFLRSSGFTVSDLLLRVRVEMLPSRITQHVLAGRHGKQREHAMTEFVKRFKLAWVSRTYCAPALRIEICGHSLPATWPHRRPRPRAADQRTRRGRRADAHVLRRLDHRCREHCNQQQRRHDHRWQALDQHAS